MVLLVGGCIAAYFFYVKHQANSDVEAIRDVIYRLTERLRLAQAHGHTVDHNRIEWMVKWIDRGLSAKLYKQPLTTEELSEIGKATGLASGPKVLNLISVYPGTSQYARYSGAMMRLAVATEKLRISGA